MVAETGVILANFGGPRTLDEVTSFLTELLTDEDVIRPKIPRFLHSWLFKKIAQRRAPKISHDYAIIGGKSPVFEDTEAIAAALQHATGQPVFAFHRYLPAMHAPFFDSLNNIKLNKFLVVPLYPQFSYATTGSVARLFAKKLSPEKTIQWVKSYPTHPHYIQAMENCLRTFLQANSLREEEVFLFFSAHGLPQHFVTEGDPYESECIASYDAIRAKFPQSASLLAFQSKFGPGQWLKPYTGTLCNNPQSWNKERKHIVFVPLSFTSDHLETLFEIEHLYVPAIRAHGLHAYRCPALNRRPDWIDTLSALLHSQDLTSNELLIRL